jgi:hypothetical protein
LGRLGRTAAVSFGSHDRWSYPVIADKIITIRSEVDRK